MGLYDSIMNGRKSTTLVERIPNEPTTQVAAQPTNAVNNNTQNNNTPSNQVTATTAATAPTSNQTTVPATQPLQGTTQPQQQAATTQTQTRLPGALEQANANLRAMKEKEDKDNDVLTFLEKQAADYKAQLETPEQRRKREKREKWEKAISAIGDTTRAFANLFFTTRDAPNMWSRGDTLSEKTQQRLYKAKGERDAILDNYLNYALKLKEMKDAEKDKADKAQQQKFENDLKQAKDKRDAALADIKLKVEQGKLTVQKAAAEKAKAEAKYADDYYKAKADNEKARGQQIKASTRAANASATASYARAAKTRQDMNKGNGNNGNGIKSFGDYAVKQKNWDDDSYINQLWTRLNGVKAIMMKKGANGKINYGTGVRDLFDNVRDDDVDAKRAAIETLFAEDYDRNVQTEMGEYMTDFDNRYSTKR